MNGVRMKNRILAVAAASFLAVAGAACADNAEDHAREASESRVEAAQEAAGGDTADAAEEMREAARHDSAAAVDSAQGDGTEGPN
jgi:hypothetical protein